MTDLTKVIQQQSPDFENNFLFEINISFLFVINMKGTSSKFSASFVKISYYNGRVDGEKRKKISNQERRVRGRCIFAFHPFGTVNEGLNWRRIEEVSRRGSMLWRGVSV